MARLPWWGAGPSYTVGVMDITYAVDVYLRHRLRTTPRSWHDQAKTMRRMVAHFGDNREVESITWQELQEWRDSWGIKGQSANKYFDRVRSFYAYLARFHDVPNPTHRVIDLAETAPARIEVAPELFAGVLDAARHPRDRAAIALSMELLPRGNEIARLRVRDLNLGKRTVKMVVSKGPDEIEDVDEMAISAALTGELSRWHKYYLGTVGISPDYYLFPGMDARYAHGETQYVLHPTSPISEPWQVVKYALARAGCPVERGTGFHSIRRSAARVLFDHLADEKGWDSALSYVSSLMHHRSRATTERYLGVQGDRYLRNKIIRGGGYTPLSLATPDNSTGSVSAMPTLD